MRHVVPLPALEAPGRPLSVDRRGERRFHVSHDDDSWTCSQREPQRGPMQARIAPPWRGRTKRVTGAVRRFHVEQAATLDGRCSRIADLG